MSQEAASLLVDDSFFISHTLFVTKPEATPIETDNSKAIKTALFGIVLDENFANAEKWLMNKPDTSPFRFF
ncbi:hypothetical protein L2596_004681, partial [Vibrio vulnificus]|nr:hypothetical protein [Vibrio vulnificus]